MARWRLSRVLADKVYSSKANRDHLRRRGITAIIPIKADQATKVGVSARIVARAGDTLLFPVLQ